MQLLESINMRLMYMPRLESMEWMVLVIVVFSLWFFLTSLQERCWYRRFVVPVMLLALIFFIPSNLGRLGLIVSAARVYFGYKGRGRAAMAQSEGEEK